MLDATMAKFKIFIPICIIILIPTSDCTSDRNFENDPRSQSIYHGLAYEVATSPQYSICSQQMSTIVEGLANGTKWAVKLLDASGTPRSGIRWGNTYWLGNKKQCEATMSRKRYSISPVGEPITIEAAEDVPSFPVNYFGAYFIHTSNIQNILKLKNEFRITLGLCLPSSCDPSEITESLQKYFDTNTLQFQKIYNSTLTMENTKKVINNPLWFDDGFSITLGCILTTLIFLALVGTVYDVKIYNPLFMATQEKKQKDSIGTVKCTSNESNGNYSESNLIYESGNNEKKTRAAIGDISLAGKILACFSVYKNHKTIFNTETSIDSINCIYGLRFLSMASIISGHTGLFLIYFFDNRAYLIVLEDTHIGHIFGSISFVPDINFCISGYLFTYFFLKSRLNKNLNGLKRKLEEFLSTIVRRISRIVPSYIVAVLLTGTLISWTQKSSVFWQNERDDINCKKYWWRNILFINNLYPITEMCQVWSWYLSNDMQFYIIMCLLSILAVTQFKLAASILTFIFVSCIGYGAYATYIWEYIPVTNRMYELVEVFYNPPWMRINPFIVGSVAGYLVYKLNKTLPINKYMLWFLWICSVCSILFMVFVIGDRNMSLLASMVYIPLSRIIWALNTAWIIIACETGNGGGLNRLLSLKMWIPLSNITFWAFLLNPLVLLLFGSLNERPMELDFHVNFILFPGFIIWTYCIAYIFTLLLEMPVAAAYKIITDNFNKNISHKSADVNATNATEEEYKNKDKNM